MRTTGWIEREMNTVTKQGPLRGIRSENALEEG